MFEDADEDSSVCVLVPPSIALSQNPANQPQTKDDRQEYAAPAEIITDPARLFSSDENDDEDEDEDDEDDFFDRDADELSGGLQKQEGTSKYNRS